MRALRPMSQEEREFAEQRHDLVIDFLHRKHLPIMVVVAFCTTASQRVSTLLQRLQKQLRFYF